VRAVEEALDAAAVSGQSGIVTAMLARRLVGHAQQRATVAEDKVGTLEVKWAEAEAKLHEAKETIELAGMSQATQNKRARHR